MFTVHVKIRLSGLLVGLLGIVVDTLGEVTLAPEPAPLVHLVGALGLGDHSLNEEQGGDYQG